MPEGLQSRHGILSAYWWSRVLPAGDTRAAGRRMVLLRSAENEAHGRRLHGAAEAAYQELASEGVFVAMQGAYLFRHVLLRDFALMQWGFDAGGPREIASRLTGIGLNLVRFSALRAAIEAACDRSPVTVVLAASPNPVTPCGLISALAADRGTLMMAADILGELDDPAPIDVGAIAGGLLPTGEAAVFVLRVVQSAKLSLNQGWLDRILVLPDSAVWAESTPWVSAALLGEIAKLIEVLLCGPGQRWLPMPSEVHRGLGRRLRAWSQAPRTESALLAEGAWKLAELVKIVVLFEPSAATLEWIADHATRSPRMRTTVVEMLPHLVTRAQAFGERIDEAVVESLYLETGGSAGKTA